MSNPEQKSTSPQVNFGELKYWGFPLGELMIHFTHLSEDSYTRQGLSKARDLLQNRGLIILDAHLTPLDIIATGIAVSENIELEGCIVPVSTYDFYFPFFRKGFFGRINKMDGFELYPVCRVSDSKSWRHKFFFPQELTTRKKREAVLAYHRRTLEVIEEPHKVVLVAAYNGVNQLGNELAGGVERILESGCPALASLAVFDRELLRYKVFLSEDLLQFSQVSQKDEMHTLIHSSHLRLLEKSRPQAPQEV